MKNILLASRRTYRIFRIALVAAVSILILNAECNADLCSDCLKDVAIMSLGINPSCKVHMPNCIYDAGCSQAEVNSAVAQYCH